jgi:5-hydroxyisourate hydrolase
MSAVTTHVLDVGLGRPAAGIAVTLEQGGEVIGDGTTDHDGRITSIGPDRVVAGTYRLRFATGAYYEAQEVDHFHPEVTVDFTVAEPAQHFHVPLLLSPFSYSTYRGS